MKTKKHIESIAEAGILIGLAVVLSFIQFPMPLGASITLASMLPICVIGIRNGAKMGFLSAFIYSLIQLLIGILKDGLLAWGLDGISLFGCIMLDYLLAYTCLGLSSLFRNKGTKGLFLGILVAFSTRFLFHTISGAIIFSNLAQWTAFGKTFDGMPWLYSICYNGVYMLPELIISSIALFIMIKIPYVRDNIIKKGA